MEINHLPKLNPDNSETGCCPRFDPSTWDNLELTFQDKLFVKAATFNILHIPLNMGSMMTKTWKMITDAQANDDEFAVLSTDPSLWRGEHYFAVTKEVPGATMVKLTGHYLAKVYEGPFQNAGKWAQDMDNFVKGKGKQMQNLYFYYTTCPKCAKVYGKNYVVAVAQV